MKQGISSNIKKVLFLINSLTLIFIISLFIFKDNIKTLLYPICTAYFILLIFFSILFFGYKKDKKSKEKTKVNNRYIIFSTLYLVTVYLVGNVTGSSDVRRSIETSIYIVLLVFAIEIFRYCILSKASKSSNETYILTFILMLFDILIFSDYSPQTELNVVALFSIVLIAVIKNSMLTFTASNFSYKPCLLYSLIVTALPMILPNYPDLGGYLTIVFLVIYTLTLFYNISKPTRKDDEETANEYEKGPLFYIERVSLVLVVIIIMFVSGVFKYSISAIASDSMYPEIKKGDAVILEKASEKNLEKLEKDMIIAFKENDQVITHRILSIDYENDIMYITTKGDNNSTKDVTKKTKDDIIGIVRLKIPYIGYPSVEISEIKNKNK